jgi:hypothetical protein
VVGIARGEAAKSHRRIGVHRYKRVARLREAGKALIDIQQKCAASGVDDVETDPHVNGQRPGTIRPRVVDVETTVDCLSRPDEIGPTKRMDYRGVGTFEPPFDFIRRNEREVLTLVLLLMLLNGLLDVPNVLFVMMSPSSRLLEV